MTVRGVLPALAASLALLVSGCGAGSSDTPAAPAVTGDAGRADTAAYNCDSEKSKCASTSPVSSETPSSSSTALVICTQVVAIIPPKST